MSSERYDAKEVALEYKRLSLTGWLLVASAVPMTAVAILLGFNTAMGGFPWLYRILFGLVAVVGAVLCKLLRNILDSTRSIQRPDDESDLTMPQRVERLAILLVTVPASILVLGLALRLLLGGTAVDYAVFLAVALALWVAFFPRREQFERWVRLRTV